MTITNAGPSSGSYLVTEVQHTYSSAGFNTRFIAGDRRPARLVDSLGGTRRAAPQHGLMIGVVTQVDAANESGQRGQAEIPDALGLRSRATGRGSSRSAAARARCHLRPEVNDEVLVGFEQGDFTRPVVLGGLFNSADTMVDTDVVDGKVNRRRITSRDGHVIELGDGTDNATKYIALTLAGGQHTVKMSKERLDATVPAGTPVSIKPGNHGITISNTGDITIEGQKVTIKATSDIELAGVNITSKASVKAETSATTLAVEGERDGGALVGRDDHHQGCDGGDQLMDEVHRAGQRQQRAGAVRRQLHRARLLLADAGRPHRLDAAHRRCPRPRPVDRRWCCPPRPVSG